MSMSISGAARIIAAVLALAGAGPALALAGSGIRLGGSEGRLHPFVELETRYDTNVYYTDTKESVGDAIIHVRPGLQLMAPGDLAAVDLTASLDWAQYLGVQQADTAKNLSKMYGQALLAVTLNKRGAIGLEIDDEFRRSQSSTAFNLPAALLSNYNVLTLRAPWKPGGGALVIAPTVGWTLETFEPYFSGDLCDPATAGVAPEICTSDGLKKLGYNEFRVGADARWRFLPRTSAVFEVGWFSRSPNASAIDVPLGGVTGTGATATVRIEKLTGVTVQTGMTGLVTPHVGATVKAGYGGIQGSALGSMNTFVGTVETEWLPIETASMRVGYTRGTGIDPGSVLSAYSSSRVYGGAKYLLGGRYALHADVFWEERSYDFISSSSASLVRVEPSLDMAFTRFLVGTLGYAYTNRDSSFPGVTPQLPGFSYSKNEAWLKVAFTY